MTACAFWVQDMIGSLIVTEAPVIAASQPLFSGRGLGLGFQERLHLRAPIAGRLGGAEVVEIGQRAEDFGEP